MSAEIATQDIASWEQQQIDIVTKQISILRDKIKQGKGWPGIEQELEEKRAALRALLVSVDLGDSE